MLTPEHRQEAVTQAYIRAIAGHAGMSCSVRDFDYGIDLTLHEVTTRTDPQTGRKRHIESGWPLDLQVKSTISAILEADAVTYDLDVQTYNDLRNADIRSPRILVVHVQPRDERERLEQTTERLCLAGCCYWISLRGRASCQSSRSTRIRIPRENVFSVDQLREIMRRVKAGEPL